MGLNVRGEQGAYQRAMLLRRESIVRMRKDGFTLRAIGNQFDISYQRVRQIVLKMRRNGNGQ